MMGGEKNTVKIIDLDLSLLLLLFLYYTDNKYLCTKKKGRKN